MLKKIEDILFATDLSPNSDYALRFALSTANAHKAKIHVLHVAEPLSQDAVVTLRMFMQGNGSSSEAMDARFSSVKQALKDNQKAFLDSLTAEEKNAFSAVSSVELVEGHPAEKILRRASELDCQLIIMASHEQSTEHTFLGTVTKRVLRRSSIPVLVVPSGE